MSSSWGKNLKISIFGESHGPGIGVVIDGIPAGIRIDYNNISQMLGRRRPGQAAHSTTRKETDEVEILSGVYNGYTTGTPIAGVINNSDTRSHDYKDMPLRPSHADYSGLMRYSGYNDPRGGGHFSGRLTAPLVFAGAIAKEALNLQNIFIGGYIDSIYTINDNPDKLVTKEALESIQCKNFPVFDSKQGTKMRQEIEKARMNLDSLGGVVGLHVLGMPGGIGSPMFDGIENRIAEIVMGIPAVRGIEFGTGFNSTKLKGSEHNDPFIIDGDKIKTATNHHGGVIGGISTGMPIQMRVAFKPTASISRPQTSVDYRSMQPTTLEITGRHDPCIVPRAVPCVEAAVALAILDIMLEGGNPNVSWDIPRKNQ